MDIATVQLILKASQIVIDASKRDEMIGRVSAIQSTLDQLFLREIKSSFDAIGDALTTGNEQTRTIRLNYAEENLLKNTSLDPSLTTGEYKNTYLMALTYYGLAFVCLLRGDHQISAKHVIRCYKFDPHMARTKLTPIVYKEIFKPKCANIFEWHQKRVSEIFQDECTFRVIRGKAAAATIGIGALVAGIAARQPGPAGAGIKEAGKMWNNSNPSHYHSKDMANLNIELESKLDERCRKIALELLSER